MSGTFPQIATSADWVRGYKWALAKGDPPTGKPRSKEQRKMFMAGYEAGLKAAKENKAA
jgi:hypothetical protein